MKNFLLHTLTVRVVYMCAALVASHAIAFLAAGPAQAALTNVFVNPALLPGAGKYLEAMLSGLLLVAGEFAFHGFNGAVIQPLKAS